MSNDENKFQPIFQILHIKSAWFLLELAMALVTTIGMRFLQVCFWWLYQTWLLFCSSDSLTNILTLLNWMLLFPFTVHKNKFTKISFTKTNRRFVSSKFGWAHHRTLFTQEIKIQSVFDIYSKMCSSLMIFSLHQAGWLTVLLCYGRVFRMFSITQTCPNQLAHHALLLLLESGEFQLISWLLSYCK